MKQLILLGAAALIALSAAPAWAVPMCDNPQFDQSFQKVFGKPAISQDDQALNIERELNRMGIDATNTRFWNGCVQTFVREDGHTVMKFYNPDTLQEIPVN
ncbi:MAG TPA: hypothetical protein VHZ56_09185 [Devosia sp.]|jgi:hypothetical protein|nr:hypothetical protein [Devosia sp.]